MALFTPVSLSSCHNQSHLYIVQIYYPHFINKKMKLRSSGTIAAFIFNIAYNFLPSIATESALEFPAISEQIPGSPWLLWTLADREEQIYPILREVWSQCDIKNHTCPDLLKRYVEQFELSTARLRFETYRAPSRAVAVVWNPIASFHMVKRFHRLLKPLMVRFAASETERVVSNQVMEIVGDFWPTEDDVRASCSIIGRLQTVYDFSTADVVNGILAGYESGLKLSACDCNDIGKVVISDGSLYLGVEWFKVALELFPKSSTTHSPCSLKEIWENMDLAAAAHDGVFQRSHEFEYELFTSLQRTTSPKMVRRRTTLLETWNGSKGFQYHMFNYWGTCSGENYQTEQVKSGLFCWYETEINLTWKINPLKAELLSSHPLIIVQYYDVIGDSAIQKIKRVAGSRLTRSQVFQDANKYVVNPVRTSVNTFLFDTEDPLFAKVANTVGYITGLEVREAYSAEALQVASYSSGGHYLVHQDPLHINSAGGERLATFLFYLSDVLEGGGTAFPLAGVAPKPVKGSAVFWYSLTRAGVVENSSWHGACPVILGEKWIGNKWIHQDAQMFFDDHKCLLDQTARAGFRVNGVPL